MVQQLKVAAPIDNIGECSTVRVPREERNEKIPLQNHTFEEKTYWHLARNKTEKQIRSAHHPIYIPPHARQWTVNDEKVKLIDLNTAWKTKNAEKNKPLNINYIQINKIYVNQMAANRRVKSNRHKRQRQDQNLHIYRYILDIDVYHHHRESTWTASPSGTKYTVTICYSFRVSFGFLGVFHLLPLRHMHLPQPFVFFTFRCHTVSFRFIPNQIRN